MTDERSDATSPAGRWEAARTSETEAGPSETAEEHDVPGDGDPSGVGAATADGAAADGDAVDGDAVDGEEASEDETSAAAGQTAGGPGAALAALTGRGGASPPAPPKRTGIFVDPDELRSHVGGLLRAMLGGYQVDAWGNYTFTHEDARIFVTVGMSPMGPQVGVFSVTNVEVDLTSQLAGFLLVTNHQLNFGAFSFDPEGQAVWLRHSLLGTTLDGPELHSAVAAIASTAAHFDDVIRDRFGGRRFTDASQDVQDATHPPDPSQTGHPNASGYL